jgi:TPP-dependent pyruvate/acetoin dehydrogenase alpha subunit
MWVGRSQVSSSRESRDPIDQVRKIILEHSFLTDKELKDLDKKVEHSLSVR